MQVYAQQNPLILLNSRYVSTDNPDLPFIIDFKSSYICLLSSVFSSMFNFVFKSITLICFHYQSNIP